MPLTPEEQEELAFLEAHFETKERDTSGRSQVDTFNQARRRPAAQPAQPRPFSTYRALVGGVRDAFQGILDTGSALDDWMPIGPVVNFGSAADNGIFEIESRSEWERQGGQRPTLPNLEGSDNAGTAERLVRGVTSFAVPFTAALRATSALRGFGIVGRVGQGLAAGAAADFVQYDPVGGNIANLLRDTFGIDNAMLDSLAAEEDDTALMARFKAAAAGAPLGLAGDAVFEAGGRLLKLYRAWKGSADEAAATVASFKQGPVKVDVPAPRPEPKIDATEADEVIPPSDAGGAKAATEDPLTYGPVDPEDFDDVLDFLKSKAGDIEMDEETFGRFAKALVEGDPEDALVKLGIDPLKINFSKYRDPDMLGRLHRGLAEVYEGLAARLGRSNTRVSEKAIIRGAEAMASTPDVLRSLYGSTNKLAEEITASRLFVGAHAIKLLGDARAALREIEAGVAGPAWAQFLESFHTHAYFMGALRGAGSEVGRALRSLQIIVRDKDQAARVLNAADEADQAAAQVGARKFTLEEGASAFASGLESDADKIVALRRLIDLRGDVSELSRTVREGNGRALNRINQAIKETVGSLFGLATATYNVGAGVTFIGLNALGRLGAAMARTPALALGGRHAAEARRAWLETWAYTEGVLGGFREAWDNTLAVMEREGLSEAAINLDGLGLTGLAKQAAKGSAKAGEKIVGHFERADVVNTKAFSLTTAERRGLQKFAESLPGPKFFQAGLRGLVNLTAAGVNAAGTGFRTGTTLFINLPDEFVGTLTTRAGAYAKAVQIAAREADALGLRGADVGTFIKARTIQLFGDGPKGWSPDGVDGGAHHALARAGEAEAKMILFQDELELGISRGIARAVNATGGLGSLVIPFVKTPLRILERTAIDFSPLGLFKGRIRKAIAAGGSQRDEALARLSLSILAVTTAFQLAEDREIVGHDGGYLSTARDAGRPSYSLKIGDDVYEFSRLDPIGTLLGFGADLRASLDAAGDDPEAGGTFAEITEALIWATAANVLSKTWLTSIRNLTDLAGATSEDDAGLRWDKFLTGLSTRAVPASGVQRSLQNWMDGQVREATNFSDGLLRSTIGADALPVKRDTLGRPVQSSGMNRLAGMRADVMPADAEDPVMAEFERLSMREPASQRRQKGVKLNATQFSRFLELRGQVVRDPTTGLTMEEALNTLVQMPDYKALPKAARIAEIRKVTRGYNTLAAEALTNEDKSYALARLRVELFEQAALQGWDPDRRDTELTRFAQQLGLQQ